MYDYGEISDGGEGMSTVAMSNADKLEMK